MTSSWKIIEPLLMEEPPKPEGGRPRIDLPGSSRRHHLRTKESAFRRRCFAQEMSYGSGITCWRTLEGMALGWSMEPPALEFSWIHLGEVEQIDWERASLDSASVSAIRGELSNRSESNVLQEKRERSAMLWSTQQRCHAHGNDEVGPTCTSRWYARIFWIPLNPSRELLAGTEDQHKRPEIAACRQRTRMTTNSVHEL